MDTSDDIDVQLAALLDSRTVDECMRVDAVLKQSAFETTQRVFFQGANGSEIGPFIRKVFPGSRQTRELGDAYQALFRAQESGVRLAHLPRILQVLDSGDMLVVLMECVSGDTLRNRIDKHPCERMQIATAIAPQLCDAVSDLHGGLHQTIIHRDITPSNILCCGDEAVPVSIVLIDLGIAREHKPEATKDTSRFGTEAYAAPEQFGFGQTDTRSDVYSIGMTLAFCLLGHDPSPQEREAGFKLPGIDPSLAKVLAKATAFDPSDRYQSARDLKDALLRACMRQDASAKRPRRLSQDAKVAIVAACCVACIAIGSFLLLPILNQEPGFVATGSKGATSDTSTTETPKRAPKEDSGTSASSTGNEVPLITGSGLSQDGKGNVFYAVALTNPYDDIALGSSKIQVTGKDASGAVILSTSYTGGKIGPGETVYCGGRTTCQQMPADVDFSVSPTSAKSIPASEYTGAAFSTRGLNARDVPGGTIFLGEVVADGAMDSSTNVQVVVILRDSAGGLLAGQTDYLTIPAGSSSCSFELPWQEPPEHASWDAYVVAQDA